MITFDKITGHASFILALLCERNLTLLFGLKVYTVLQREKRNYQRLIHLF